MTIIEILIVLVMIECGLLSQLVLGRRGPRVAPAMPLSCLRLRGIDTAQTAALEKVLR